MRKIRRLTERSQRVIKGLLRRRLGDDLKIKSGTLELVGEYLRLFMVEMIERSVAAAKLKPKTAETDAFVDELAAEEKIINVQPEHVMMIVHSLLTDF